MEELKRRITFRVNEKEYQRLQTVAEEKKYTSLSQFVRDSLLEHNGISSNAMKKQMYDMQWELNKIGVNINQAVKHINSGYGSFQDVQTLLENQEELKVLLKRYIAEVDEKWQ